MKNGKRTGMIIVLFLLGLVTAGCGGRKERPEDKTQEAAEQVEGNAEIDTKKDAGDTGEEQEGMAGREGVTGQNQEMEDVEEKAVERKAVEGAALKASSKKTEDYSKYFSGLKGCAVIYDKKQEVYHFYNENACNIRISPCSTFKIISTLIGLNHGILSSKDTLMGYDGTEYATKAWNADLRLEEAFQTSCIWYFRKVIDQVGKKEVERELELLSYGNCDISEWEGGHINQGIPQLNGFWLESSLEISPLEQADVMASIFEGETEYAEEDVKIVRDIMKTDARDGISVYGKTGTGSKGKAWFVGYFEKNELPYYFSVCINDPAQENAVTGADAKQVAMKIITKGFF